MRTSRSTLTLLAAFAALGGFFTSANAQSVATQPVGAVSVAVSSNSDQRLGATLQRPVLFASAAQSVAGSTLNINGTVAALGSEQKYVKFLSGALEGQWFTLTASSASSVSVAENLQSLGAISGDKFEIRAFWTLGSLFPAGAGFPASADFFSPSAFVLLNDPAAIGVNLSASNVYFYHDGSIFDAGWYNNDGSFDVVNNTVISPETSIIIRNGTVGVASIVTVGDVPSAKMGNVVLSRVEGPQDNLVYNPYPAAITLDASGLGGGAVRASSDPFDPSDLVLFYSTTSTGFNPAASDVFFYHDGSVFDAGWYKNDGSFVLVGSTPIPSGAAITIRKSGGAASDVNWVPALPYTL
jgi:uncharacterized protein (TIGR02597 family)